MHGIIIFLFIALLGYQINIWWRKKDANTSIINILVTTFAFFVVRLSFFLVTSFETTILIFITALSFIITAALCGVGIPCLIITAVSIPVIGFTLMAIIFFGAVASAPRYKGT